ncbi:hypothetical protein D3C83_80420 [compost metagenome]
MWPSRTPLTIAPFSPNVKNLVNMRKVPGDFAFCVHRLSQRALFPYTNATALG